MSMSAPFTPPGDAKLESFPSTTSPLRNAASARTPPPTFSSVFHPPSPPISPDSKDKKLAENSTSDGALDNGSDHGAGKEALSNDETAPKTAVLREPETEETNPKIGYVHDDKAGSGIEASQSQSQLRGGQGDARQEEVTEEERGEDEWHFGFWDSCQPSNLCRHEL